MHVYHVHQFRVTLALTPLKSPIMSKQNIEWSITMSIQNAIEVKQMTQLSELRKPKEPSIRSVLACKWAIVGHCRKCSYGLAAWIEWFDSYTLYI